jgi:hypothetical protein
MSVKSPIPKKKKKEAGNLLEKKKNNYANIQTETDKLLHAT